MLIEIHKNTVAEIRDQWDEFVKEENEEGEEYPLWAKLTKEKKKEIVT